jgi:molecular chaperone HscA
MRHDLSHNHFELFGLKAGFEVDGETLALRYRDLQKETHPDRFANASEQERRLSVQLAAQINEAFRVLKSPLARARYLLELKGVVIDDTDTRMDPAFLMEQMELREAPRLRGRQCCGTGAGTRVGAQNAVHPAPAQRGRGAGRGSRPSGTLRRHPESPANRIYDMALLQISEPGQSTAPHQHRLAAGIDLGTTNSLVATVRSGLAEALPDETGNCLLPSVVRYLASGERIVGKEAKDEAAKDPLNTIISAKRFMGRGVADVKSLGSRLPYEFVESDSGMPRLRTVGGDFSPVEVSADILKTLKKRAENSLGGDLSGVVITVPAYFDDAQRQATKDAAKLAGLNVLRLLNEPTAAAVAYGLDRGSEGVIAVYDLGGGTFDISILRLHKGVFEVLATAGDSALGGDDMDRVVAEWIMEQAGIAHDADHAQLRRLMRDACDAKELLTEVPNTTIRLELADGSFWEGQLTREKFNELVDPLILKTLAPCRRALRDAGVSREEIHDVVMVGGSTRVPRVREKVTDFFGAELRVDIDPDKVVAVGAAMQADVLVGNKPEDEMLLLDVIPLSLGLETMGGLVEKIIPRNTTIPVARAQDFTTFKDGQTAMAIHVLQGERELVIDCRSLARFELRGIPPMAAGAARIRVTFQVDADGLLSVMARELISGVESSVQVKPSYGLSDDEITRMLQDSMEHAREDMDLRQLREQQVEADRVIDALRVALAKDGDKLLSAEERAEIERGMAAVVQAATHSTNYKEVKQAIDALNRGTTEFAARRMNASIQQALSGHKVEDFN